MQRSCSSAETVLELSQHEIDQVAGGVAPALLFIGAAAAAAAVVVTAAVVVDNRRNGSLADFWYRATN